MNKMRESSYREKMAALQKRKNIAKSKIDELTKDLKEQREIVKKTDYDMLTLSIEYRGITAEKTVELIESKIRELKEQEQPKHDDKAEYNNKVYGGIK